jgi:hypothetical protein
MRLPLLGEKMDSKKLLVYASETYRVLIASPSDLAEVPVTSTYSRFVIRSRIWRYSTGHLS